jgi:hypothetical protein
MQCIVPTKKTEDAYRGTYNAVGIVLDLYFLILKFGRWRWDSQGGERVSRGEVHLMFESYIKKTQHVQYCTKN